MVRTQRKARSMAISRLLKLLQMLYSGFAKVTKPLTELTEKIEWKWRIEERNVFKKLKKLIISTCILTIPNADHKLYMEVVS